jgi:hypothetical protein
VTRQSAARPILYGGKKRKREEKEKGRGRGRRKEDKLYNIYHRYYYYYTITTAIITLVFSTQITNHNEIMS